MESDTERIGMERIMSRKKKRNTVIICAGILAAATVLGIMCLRLARTGRSLNLALQKGVTATCDSTENDELSADRAVDGNAKELSSRWSSENNREDASHYIKLEFPEEISVSFVVLKWERLNVTDYALEGSVDGENWEVLESFHTAPEVKDQEIILAEAAKVKYLRLSTYEVSDNTENYYDLYQNVSLYEFEVYADKPAAYQIGKAKIGCREDGSRFLVMPGAPEGYEVTFLGADYEQVVGADGRICNTIQDKEVTVGFCVKNRYKPADTREISQTLNIPAYDGAVDAQEQEVSVAEAQERNFNECPAVIPAIAEWQGRQGRLEMGGDFRVIVEKGSELQEAAQLFADGYQSMARCMIEVTEGSMEDARPGDLYLGIAREDYGLGEEGYICDITDICVIEAQTKTGVRWGTVTLLQILSQEGFLPCGQIRDYPLYQVRGFGIDVARKAVSLDMLYAIVEKMSYYKMNDLAIHLNDNTILSTSGLTDSVEQAMTADSAFRLETDIRNDAGEMLTSQEYAYTKEEFDTFIRKAKTYGVTVVPEIDTPAHSLSITKLFPEYALTASPESVDQIDLGNAEAVAFMDRLWEEMLLGEDAPFRNAETVNIGMDEYYGDGEQYRTYAARMAEFVKAQDKTVRLWGSLSNMKGKTMPDPDGMQMNLWSTAWADPRTMYESGYSLINMQNNHLYVIPGGGYDYLNLKELYTDWMPNKFYDYNTMELLPCYSPRMLGAAYMIWNDMSGNLDLGLSEYDLYARFEEPLAVLSIKLWGMENTVGAAESYEDFVLLADRIDEAAYGVKGEGNRVYGSAIGVEPPYEVEMKVYLEEDGEEGGRIVPETEAAKTEAGTVWKEQILAQSDSAYGVWAFYAVEPQTGKTGFAREGRTYTWDYVLPRGQWVELKVIGELGQTTLYADGKLVGTLGSKEPFEEYATFVFPVQRIAAKTGTDAVMEGLVWNTGRMDEVEEGRK